MLRLRLAIAVVLAATFWLPTASADRTAAEFYAQRGDKAAREKDWAGAQTQFRKALEEDATFLPARLGLAEALLAAGDKGAGVDELRRFLDAAESLRPMPPAWNLALERGRKRLAEVDLNGAQLDQIVDKYVGDLLSTAERWLVKDPDAAGAALAEVVRLRSDNPRAKTLLDKLEKVDAAAWIPLFNGKDRSGWLDLGTKEWGVVQGALDGSAPAICVISRTQASYHGDFDCRMEMKVVERIKDPMFLLELAMKGDQRCAAFGVLGDSIGWEEQYDPTHHETKFAARPSELPKPVDTTQWVVYEMRFRGDKCYALLNGDVVATLPRDPDRDGGQIGLRIQGIHVQIRKLELHVR